MFCRFCGATHPEDSTFCPKCGRALGATIQTTAGSAAAPAMAPVPTTSARGESPKSRVLAGAIIAAALVIGLSVFLSRSQNKSAQLAPISASSSSPAQNTLAQSSAVANVKPGVTRSAEAAPAPPPIPELSTEELFKMASPSVVWVEGFNASGEKFGTGSGFVASDGAIVTNYHVIRGAYSADVRLQDGSTIPIQGEVGFDPNRDVAVIKANSLSAKSLTLGDSERLQIGDKVIAIGSPLAIQNTLSDGLVSGIRNGLIQTSTPISPGSSGGPLFNTRGEVVGIAVAQVLGAQNINFAVPINWAKGFLRNSDVTVLSELAKQNTVDQEVMESTISVPAGNRRAFPILVDHNRMADSKLEGTFSSTGGVGGNIRVLVVGQNRVLYDSGRANSGTVHVALAAGSYQLVIDNSGSAMFPRSITGDFKLHYVK